MANNLKKKGKEILSLADIKINGEKPWDIQVYNENVFQRAFADGSLGVGESYMDGWWDAKELDQFFFRVFSANLQKKINPIKFIIPAIKARIINLQRKSKAYEIGKRHYDLGNDIYSIMLDKRMTYTCGYWQKAKNLDQAQEAKLDLVCKKLGLKEGQRVLDIGCGWGSFAKYAAEKYGVSVVGITVSKEQVELARKMCSGLPIEIRLQDYRDLNEKFDHIVSLGMIEHVGKKNYKRYMRIVHKCLKDEGLFLLQTIGSPRSYSSGDPWIEKYIFPNSMLPSMKQLSHSMEGLFVTEDFHNFGADYDKTLMAWYNNFDKNFEKLKPKYDERFYRMWKFYLLSCAAMFRSRDIQLWQIVLSKKGVHGGYKPVR